MTRFLAMLACFLVAADCFEAAAGYRVPRIFAGDLWMWWLAMVGWIITGYGTFRGGMQ